MRKERVLREEPFFTKLAFTRLLEWLDNGVDSHGERYLEMRRRLVSYFDRRNRPEADELADETLRRIGRTLEEAGRIAVTPPARYCHLVAKYVLLEDFRRHRRHVSLDALRGVRVSQMRRAAIDTLDPSLVLREERLECLDRCLQQLRPEQRELATEYYRDCRRQLIERRRNLARRLGISMNALGIRACRVRDALRACMEAGASQMRRVDVGAFQRDWRMP